MGYLHISNLYKDKTILMFKECFALEKIHGTSTHISYQILQDGLDKLSFFSGGCKYESFVALFNQEQLLEAFRKNSRNHVLATKITVYGEGYGFWLNVPDAEELARDLGLDFVFYKTIETTEEDINQAMMQDSVQAVRNGMGIGHIREGIVLRPLIEFLLPSRERVIAKHKRPEFAERLNTPRFSDPQQLQVLEDAQAIANEWVTMERLRHVIDHLQLSSPSLEDTREIINAMLEDVKREAKDEILFRKEVKKLIGSETAKLFKQSLSILERE